MEQLVYFIQAGDRGPVKIGFAVDPEARLTELQTGSPERLRLLTTLPGGPKVERLIHERLASSQLHGEWFEPSSEVESIVRRVREANTAAELRGWCERCLVLPVAAGRIRYCSAECARKVAVQRSRDLRRAAA